MSRQGRHAHPGAVTLPDPGQLILVHLGKHPHPGEVRQPVELGVRLDELPLTHPHVGDDASKRRMDVDLLLDPPGLLQLANLVGGHIQQLQPLARRFHQLLGTTADILEGTLCQRVAILQRQQILLLAGDQLRRVDAEQDGVPVHPFAGAFHPHRLHPPFGLRMQARQPRLVIVDPPHRPDVVRQGATGHTRGAHTDVLYRYRIDLDRTGRLARASLVVRIDRDVVHPHLILGRHRRGDGRIHRVTVEQRLALLRLLILCVDRDVIHPHLVLGRHR